jgi:hypothetical protein
MKKCFECEAIEDLQEHHVVPRSRGGTKTVTLCHSCHLRAHGRDSKGLNHSRLTKEGIERARKKALAEGRVWKAGGPNIKEVQKLAQKACRKKGLATAIKFKDIIYQFRSQGLSYEVTANKMNDMGLRTNRGCLFKANSVRRLEVRLMKQAEEK